VSGAKRSSYAAKGRQEAGLADGRQAANPHRLAGCATLRAARRLQSLKLIFLQRKN
jgi:hypothetical protein